MQRLFIGAVAIGLIAAALPGPATAQVADIVLDNGKIITVDDRFHDCGGDRDPRTADCRGWPHV